MVLALLPYGEYINTSAYSSMSKRSVNTTKLSSKYHILNPPSRLPIELLETFVRIVENDGDATAAAHQLGISQPSISRRLSSLRKIVASDDDRPWLFLKGKRWQLTPAGRRVQGPVSDLVRKYQQVEQFVATNRTRVPWISVACGQTAAVGIVQEAVKRFAEEFPGVQVRVSVSRAQARIAGIAGGEFDLALVADNEATIRDVAGVELFVESIVRDRFMVAANPGPKAAWRKAWESLPVRRPLTAAEIVKLPLILPERDAERRQQFEEWFVESSGKLPNVAIEVGGWQTILRYAAAGLGVGLATNHVLLGFEPSSGSNLVARALEDSALQPETIRVIARKPQGQRRPDINRHAHRLLQLLRESAPSPKVTG